jgi:hypothetical protein
MLKIEQFIDNKLLIHINDGAAIQVPTLEQLYVMLGIIKNQIKFEEAGQIKLEVQRTMTWRRRSETN